LTVDEINCCFLVVCVNIYLSSYVSGNVSGSSANTVKHFLVHFQGMFQAGKQLSNPRNNWVVRYKNEAGTEKEQTYASLKELILDSPELTHFWQPLRRIDKETALSVRPMSTWKDH
jgi:hypothetical protein